MLAGPVLQPELGEVRLAPHQLDAASRIDHLLRREGCAVLADITGMGKTFVALAVARIHGPSLIVAPASLRTMWLEAARRAGVEICLASYESLGRGRIPRAPPGLLVLDEAHHARNPGSRRYDALADLAWGRRVLALTATPVHNRLDDIRAVLALSLGGRAWSMGTDAIAASMIRRTHAVLPAAAEAVNPVRLPDVEEPEWLSIGDDPETLHAIEKLPPALPPADGGAAHALLTTGLLRAWASSAAALAAVLRRRLQRGTALLAALQAGRLPTRAQMRAWTVVDDAVQLAFPELMADLLSCPAAELEEAVRAHEGGIRRILDSLAHTGPAQDAARLDHLRRILSAHECPVVAFTQFSDTAEAMFRGMVRDGGVALVTGRGARIATGVTSTESVVSRFDDSTHAADPVMPLRILMATDVLSEGLGLRRAGVLVHLDLPWTVARLEQRIGRLRRLGSPHRRLHMYAIGPPVNTTALSHVLRILRRKARLHASFGGLQVPDLEAILDRSVRSSKDRRQSETAAAESIRSIMERWHDGSESREAPRTVAVGGMPATNRWLALALVRQGGRWNLVRVTPQGVSDRPTDVLAVVRRVDQARDAASQQSGEAVTASVRRVLDTWLESRRARALVRAVVEAPSRAHAEAIRFLDGLSETSPRVRLPVVLPVIARCRSLILESRGVGVERVLSRWLARLGEGEPLVAIGELAELLSARFTDRAREEDDAGVGALVILTGSGGDERGACASGAA